MITAITEEPGEKRRRNQAAYIRRKERFARIVADHTPFDVNCVRVAKWGKGLRILGSWYPSSRVLEMPRPINAERLAICLHEIGHAVYDEYCRDRSAPDHLCEQIADEFMEKIMKRNGVKIPTGIYLGLVKRIREVIESDIKEGREINSTAAKRVGLDANSLREMGASEEQLPWHWRGENQERKPVKPLAVEEAF